MIYRSLLLTYALLLAINSSCQTTNDITGEWKGALYSGKIPIRVIINISKTTENIYTAFIDSPDQMTFNIPVDKCKVKKDSIHLVSSVIKGTYKGAFVSPDSILGHWEQNGTVDELDLTRGISAYCVKKVQDPVYPFPYKCENISFKNDIDDIELHGTLTYPSTQNFPIVILISGSGPHDRNAYTLGHKPFLVITDYLTRHGIGVLRFDERGVGKSEGDFLMATSKDFANDVISALGYLRSRPDFSAKKIGLLGHSEGGIVAPLVEEKTKDVDFVILMAAPGLPGKKLLIDQNKSILKKAGAADSTVKKVSMQIETELELITDSVNDHDPDEIYKVSFQVMDSFTHEEKLKYGLNEINTKMRIKRLLRPWYSYYLIHDPVIALRQIDCPVLALNGDKDIQVNSVKNLTAIGVALQKNPSVSLQELKNINHMFQETQSGTISEYAVIEETISQNVLITISDWIKSLEINDN